MDDFSRELWLKSLYWALWNSADFESDFQRDWFAVWQLLKEGKEDQVPDVVLLMLKQYMLKWSGAIEEEEE